jgi:hypothetical protein
MYAFCSEVVVMDAGQASKQASKQAPVSLYGANAVKVFEAIFVCQATGSEREKNSVRREIFGCCLISPLTFAILLRLT